MYDHWECVGVTCSICIVFAICYRLLLNKPYKIQEYKAQVLIHHYIYRYMTLRIICILHTYIQYIYCIDIIITTICAIMHCYSCFFRTVAWILKGIKNKFLLFCYVSKMERETKMHFSDNISSEKLYTVQKA